MKSIYNKLCSGHTLNQTEAEELMTQICNMNFNEHQNAFILGTFKMRNLTLDELIGFRNALMNMCIPVSLSKPCIDVCGTGGDSKNTFNISTLSAFVLAASGVSVAKHGNFASSSVSGSSDVLKYFGYEFKGNQDKLNKELDKYNLCFIHAPNFHPSLKSVGSIRKALQSSTLFNLMGPLVNPAQPTHKYIGVYNKSVARLYNYFLQSLDGKYQIVHSVDGYDEISLTDDVLIYSNRSESIISKDALPYPVLKASEIYAGNTIKDAAEIFISVLKNQATVAQKNVVLVNSAIAMSGYANKSVDDCLAICEESLLSLKAYDLFKSIIQNKI